MPVVTIPVAHVGHWLANLLYLVPVLILVGAIVRQRRLDRLEAEARPDGAGPAHDDTRL